MAENTDVVFVKGDNFRVRIGIFNPVLHNIGGAEYTTIVLINALKEHGYQVVLMSNEKMDPEKTTFFFGKNLDIDAQISTLFDPSKLLPFRNPFNDYVMSLHSYVLKMNCQILIDTHSDFIHPWSDITYLQARERVFFPKSAFGLSPFLLTPLYRSSLKTEKTLFVVNRYIADFLEKKGVHCDVLYPPVNVDYFSHGHDDLYRSKKDKVVILSRLSPEKKLEKIPFIAKRTSRDISFVIAGSCQSMSAYKAVHSLQALINQLRVEDRVKLLFNISRENVRNLLWSSKAYLHTGENEPFGITIVEAMASGCIPIVHNSGGPKEIVPEDLRYTTVEEAAVKIENAVLGWSAKKSNQMADIAKKFDEKEFSKGFLDVLNSYIKNRF